MEKENWEEVKNSWVKFNKIGDHIIGTLVGVREIQSSLPGKENEMVKVYELKGDSGECHETDDKKVVVEPGIEIKEGEIWNIGGGSKESPSILDNQFRNIKLGQKVKVIFDSEKESKKKGFNSMKVKKVYTNGKMDDVWLKEQEDAA